MGAVHLLEDGGDAADGQKLDGLAEALDGGEMAVTVFRAEVCDAQHLLQGAGGGDDLAEDGPHRRRRQVAVVLVVDLDDVLQDFFLALRREDVVAGLVLVPADLGGEAGTFVDQFEDL